MGRQFNTRGAGAQADLTSPPCCVQSTDRVPLHAALDGYVDRSGCNPDVLATRNVRFIDAAPQLLSSTVEQPALNRSTTGQHREGLPNMGHGQGTRRILARF